MGSVHPTYNCKLCLDGSWHSSPFVFVLRASQKDTTVLSFICSILTWCLGAILAHIALIIPFLLLQSWARHYLYCIYYVFRNSKSRNKRNFNFLLWFGPFWGSRRMTLNLQMSVTSPSTTAFNDYSVTH